MVDTKKASTTRKSVTDVLKPKPFYPDLPRESKDAILGIPSVLYDWVIVKNWNSSEYGQSDFAIIAFGLPESNDPEYTTIISGVAVIKKLQALSRKGLKNIGFTLVKKETHSGNEMWDIE